MVRWFAEVWSRARPGGVRYARGVGAAMGAAIAVAWVPEARSQTTGSEVVAPTVRVTAPRIVSPIPGITLQREQLTTNVQSATAKDLENAKSTSITDFMNNTMQSVNVNDYQGNPFQQDLVFRGFSASPLIGTPQGLSVYVDGVRVNEPFGEVVNWDLIPVNAIERMDLMPGSDPLFGLNTLGGALAITTRSGFTHRKVEGTVLGGSWGRRQAKVAAGGNNGTVGGFLALNVFDESGWRQNSPSSVRQAFGRVDVQGERASATVTGLHASNALTGNGMVPYDQYLQDPKAIFTSPDESSNKVTHLTANARLDFTESINMGVQTYLRKFDQTARGGDVWDDFRAVAARFRTPCGNPAFPGMTGDGAVGVDLPGCANLYPNGMFNTGRASQTANGVSWQLSALAEEHQVVVGAALDMNSIDFRQGQQLGYISDTRNVELRPQAFEELGLVPLITEIQRNNLTGGNNTGSLFIKDIWSPRPNLHLNAGLRYTRSRVTNELQADRPTPLYQFDERQFGRLEQRCGAEKGDIRARFYCSKGDFVYESLNPSFGASWLPKPDLNLYANWSRGSRVPSAIELGCARDREAEKLSGVRDTGRTPGCSVPTALSSDPYLPQVISYTSELGIRGSFSPRIAWNASVYQTNLQNDIMFVSLGARNRGVFDTFGKTRRRGLELGVDGSVGRHFFRAGYSRVDATFEAAAEVVNPSNSSSSREDGKINTFRIQPGDRLPGIPRDSLRLAWRYEATDQFNFGFTVIAHSWSYVRGNENNDHMPGGTDSSGAPTQGTLDPTITTEPGRKYVGEGKIPGYAIVNFTAGYEFNRQWSVGLRVDNIFDRSYVTAGQLGLSPFAPSVWGARDAAGFNYNSNDWTHSTFVGPGAPRAAWLSVTYLFEPGGRQ